MQPQDLDQGAEQENIRLFHTPSLLQYTISITSKY